MRGQSLIKLPLGEYRLADKYYTYTLKKYLSNDTGDKVWYLMKENQSGRTFIMFEETENVYEDSSKYQYRVLHNHISVGCFSANSPISFWSLRDLNFIPKTTYKSWLTLVDGV